MTTYNVTTSGRDASTGLLWANDVVMDYAMSGQTSGSLDHPVSGIPVDHAQWDTATRALNHVSCAIVPGQSVAVMGPSGSGKSTLLHVLAGIVRPTSGTVMFQGRDLAAMSDAERTALRRKDFGFVFQSGQLLPELPAVENIALPLMLQGCNYDRATDTAIAWLERLGLRQLAARRPGEMSGGQMQRVAIARALSIRPRVVFADEPTGALDQQTGRDVMALLMDTCRALGTAVMVVTHDASVASFCDDRMVMRDGYLTVERKG